MSIPYITHADGSSPRSSPPVQNFICRLRQRFVDWYSFLSSHKKSPLEFRFEFNFMSHHILPVTYWFGKEYADFFFCWFTWPWVTSYTLWEILIISDLFAYEINKNGWRYIIVHFRNEYLYHSQTVWRA